MTTIMLLAASFAAADDPNRASFGAYAVSLSEAKPDFAAARIRPPVGSGIVLIEITPDSPADKAGLQTCDIVTKIGDANVRTSVEYAQAIAQHKAGDQVRVWYRRCSRVGPAAKWNAQQTDVTLITAALIDRLRMAACPVQLLAGKITPNAIGTPEVTVQLRNRTRLQILAYSVEIDCYDQFGDPVKQLVVGTHTFRGVSSAPIEPHATNVTATWTLHTQDLTAKATVRMVRVKTEDRDWRPEPGKEPTLAVSRP